MNNNQQKPMQLKVSLDKTTPIACEQCESQAFQEAVMLRKVSKFLTGDAQDGVLPIATFVCAKCGHVNQDFMPKELVNKTEE
jgi:DNA-directed RNA polymerase subunit RPC12/RpoP